MATSGVITFNLTARDVVKQAMSLIGVLGAGVEPNADDAETARIHLNMMLKSMQADGCNLWRETEDSVTFAADDGAVDLDPRVIDVMEARIVLSSTYERSLAQWGWGEYVTYPNKTASGDPVVFTIRKQRGVTEMRVWPVPSVERVIRYTCARVIEDVADLANDIDVPQEWLETVVYNLAARLCEPFEVSANNPNVVARVQQRADALYAMLRNADRPGSVFFHNN